MHLLQVACDADRAASAQMLAMERQELQRQVDRAKAEMQEAKDAADKVSGWMLAHCDAPGHLWLR